MELLEAVWEQEAHALVALWRRGVPVDSVVFGETALLPAARRAAFDCVQFLLDAHADPHLSALTASRPCTRPAGAAAARGAASQTMASSA